MKKDVPQLPRAAMVGVLTLLLASANLHAEPAGPAGVAALLPEFEKIVEQGMRETHVPGVAVVIVSRDKVLYLKGFGVRKAGGDARVGPDTVFQIASVSKPITTTALAALVGEGKIDWDDPITRHLPEFRLCEPWVTREVTLRDFLCHRSGLPPFAGDLLEDLGHGRRDVLARLRFLKPASSFRSTYAYTNFGFTAAAEAGARAAGKDWEELVAEKVYRPLEMTSTSSRFADFEKAEDRATIHVIEAGRAVAKYVRNPDAQSPAGGVSTTARDLSRWMRLHLSDGKFQGKQLVSARALAETHRPQIVTGYNPAGMGRTGLYGLGWIVSYDDDGRRFLKHSGGFNLGVRSEVVLYPHDGIGIAVLANASLTGLPEALSASFFNLYLHGKPDRTSFAEYDKKFREAMGEMEGKREDFSKPPARRSPPLPADRYAGRFRNDYFGVVEVVAQGDKLHFVLGPRKTSFALTHWDRDVFTYEPVGESAVGTSAAVFRIGPDGTPDQLLLKGLNPYGAGTFERQRAK